MAAYDAVADFYDEHWGIEFAQFASAAVDRLLTPRLPIGADVLDVCCGTGLVAGHLTARGFRVAGVDESAGMIALARRNATSAQFVVGDMAEFRVGRMFDAALFLYNSLNHARSAEHLRCAVFNIAGHLRSGGLLLFDYVSREGFARGWEWSETVDGRRYEYRYDDASSLAVCSVDDNARILQLAFDEDLITGLLAAAGLSVVVREAVSTVLPAWERWLVLVRKTH